MPARNFKIIAITSEREIEQESSLINSLFDVGLELLHIRKPQYDVMQIRRLIDSISIEYRSKIVVHSHYELLNEFELRGAHLPESVRKYSDRTTIKKIISTSYHKLDDIAKEKNNFEYAFFSPVFQSISKQGYKPVTEPDTIQHFFKTIQAPFPIIALGGITDKNITEVSDWGFAGAACIGYLWENNDPVKQLQNLQRVIHG